MEKLIVYLLLTCSIAATARAQALDSEFEVTRGDREELVIVETRQVTNQRKVKNLEALQREKELTQNAIAKLERDLARLTAIIAEAQALPAVDGPK